MKKIVMWVIAVAALAAGLTIAISAGVSRTPEPLGDKHVIDTARQYEALDPLSDQSVLDFAKTKCPVIDRYGRESFTGLLERNIRTFKDNGPDVVIAMFAVTGAAVRAYCPEHISDYEQWADELEGQDS